PGVAGYIENDPFADTDFIADEEEGLIHLTSKTHIQVKEDHFFHAHLEPCGKCDNSGTPRFVESTSAPIKTTYGIWTLLESIQLFPNPTSDYLYLKSSSQKWVEQRLQLSIYSSDGRLLIENNGLTFGEMTPRIDLSVLTKGLYWVRLLIDEQVKVEKIIVE
ncbi:MAG: T9SS type A sorting domain-containing protein, partial [Bacteroidota bacterium]